MFLNDSETIFDAYSKNMEYGDEGYSDGSTYIPIKNKLLNSDILCKYVKNYLSNSSFEENTIWYYKSVISKSTDQD